MKNGFFPLVEIFSFTVLRWTTTPYTNFPVKVFLQKCSYTWKSKDLFLGEVIICCTWKRTSPRKHGHDVLTFNTMLSFAFVLGAVQWHWGFIYLSYFYWVSPVGKGFLTIRRSYGLVSDLTCSSQFHHGNRLAYQVNPSIPETIWSGASISEASPPNSGRDAENYLCSLRPNNWFHP